ncbi:MAG: phage holin, LLH family [Oscillospiraceae bacterium]
MKKIIAIALTLILILTAAAPVLAAGTDMAAVQAQTMTDLTALFDAAVVMLAAIITTFVLPWIKKKSANETDTMIKFWIDTAVHAAEQYYNTGVIRDKKEFVIDFLESKGLSVDDAQIEATVNEYFGKLIEEIEATDTGRG